MCQQERITKVVLFISIGIISLLTFSTFAQIYQQKNIPLNNSSSYDGKPLSNNSMTIGGRPLKDFQPQYGGKKIDEEALYNPYLEEAFRSMGKPLFSPNPYSYPRVITPPVSNPQTTGNTYAPVYPPEPTSYISNEGKSNITSTNNTQKKVISTLPIIPAIVSYIDALNKSTKDGDGFSGSKRLYLDGWDGYIRGSHGKSGSFSVRNTQGESVSGTYSVSGSRINFNVNYYGMGENKSWQGSSSQWSSGSSLNLYSSSSSITGSSSIIGDTYRYRFHTPDEPCEVEIRNLNKSSQAIYINRYGTNSLRGYTN